MKNSFVAFHETTTVGGFCLIMSKYMTQRVIMEKLKGRNVFILEHRVPEKKWSLHSTEEIEGGMLLFCHKTWDNTIDNTEFEQITEEPLVTTLKNLMNGESYARDRFYVSTQRFA